MIFPSLALSAGEPGQCTSQARVLPLHYTHHFLLLYGGEIKLYCNFSPIRDIARLLSPLVRRRHKYVLATVAS